MRNLKGVFSNNEWKIVPYCIYHNLEVNAVINLDGKLEICDDEKVGQRCSMFYLSEDKIHKGVIVKAMKMSDFIDMSKEQKVDYIDLCNTSSCWVSRMKIDETNRYKKAIVDRYLKESHDPSLMYLGEKSIMASCDDDKTTITMSMAVELAREEVNNALSQVLEKAAVNSFKELFDLVEAGRDTSIKN